MDLNRVRNIGVVCALAAIAIVACCLPALAAGAPVPGTPVTPAPGVPSHGRAWELTTPPDPTGTASFWVYGLSMLPDGNRIFYWDIGLLPGYPYGTPLFPVVSSTRAANGWEVAQPVGPIPNFEYRPVVFGPEESAIWSEGSEGQEKSGLYLETSGGQFQKLADKASFIGASPDLRRVIFSSSSHYLPADASRTEGTSIYERDGAGLRLLDVDAGGALLSSCGSSGKAASADGRRVYFVTRPNCEGTEHLFLAELGVGVRQISPSGLFVSVTRDGSSALFKTEQSLTLDDEDSLLDLYRYDANAGNVTLVSGGVGSPDLEPKDNPAGAGTDVGSGWTSPNGSRTYFFAAEQIGEATGATGIYLADPSGAHLIAPTATTALVNVSADGRYALLNSTAALAPGDSDGLKDVYRYDAASDDFTRLSKGSVGGNGAVAAAAEADETSTVSIMPEPPFRAMSEDGSRVFFTTNEALVPEDGNGRGDVYEWADGDVGLISSGVGKFPSSLLTSTPDGTTVLLKTADTLLPLDRDSDEIDFYAARIGGGFAEPPPPADPCPCREPGPARKRLDDGGGAKQAGSRIALSSLGAAERRQIARSGWIELLAEAPGAGRLSAEARARLGGHRVTVAATAVKVAEPGPVRLRMRLSKAARKYLASGKGLALRLRVGLAGDPAAGAAMRLQLKGRR